MSPWLGRAAVAAVTVLSGAAVLSGPRWLAVPGGLLLGFVLPGLALTAALFRGGAPARRAWTAAPSRRPRSAASSQRALNPASSRRGLSAASSRRGSSAASSRRALNAVERTVLAPALSLAVLVGAGLIVHAAGYPLDRVSWTAATVGVTLAAVLAAAFRSVAEFRVAAGPAHLFRRVRRHTRRVARRTCRPAARRTRRRLSSQFTRYAPLTLAVTAGQTYYRQAGGGSRPVRRRAVPGMTRRARRRRTPRARSVYPSSRLARQLIPMLLVVTLLGYAGRLSLADARRVSAVTVTALSATPPSPIAAARRTAQITRTVQVTASGLLAADGPYSLAVADARRHTFWRTVDVPDGGTWSAYLGLGPERITISLYRAADTTAYRTLYIAAEP